MTNWNLISPGFVTNIDAYIDATGSTNTKTSWVEIFSAAPYTGFLDLELIVHNANCGWLFDIGIGATSSEVVIAENMFLSPGADYKYGISFRLPVSIPKGERVVIRAQTSQTTFGYMYVRGSFSPIGFMGNGRIYNLAKTYGANTADSGGTNITTGSGWVSFSASADYDFKAIMLFWGEKGAGGVHSKFYIDVGTGATPDEIIGNLLSASHTSNDLITPGLCSFRNVRIAKGDALKIQGTHSDAAASIDVVALCFA